MAAEQEVTLQHCHRKAVGSAETSARLNKLSLQTISVAVNISSFCILIVSISKLFQSIYRNFVIFQAGVQPRN